MIRVWRVVLLVMVAAALLWAGVISLALAVARALS